DELAGLDAGVDDSVVLIELLDVADEVVLKNLVVRAGRAPRDWRGVQSPEVRLNEALLTGKTSGKPHSPTSMVSSPVMAARTRPPTMKPAGGEIMWKPYVISAPATKRPTRRKISARVIEILPDICYA